MDGDTDSIVNLDEPIPVLRIPSRDDPVMPSSETESRARKRDQWKEQAGKIKETIGTQYGSSPVGQSLRDKFFAKMMEQLIPPEQLEDGDEADGMKRKPEYRSRQYIDRPNFSVGLMSSNFRRFNARVGIVFVLQNRLIHLFTWRHPTSTLSFLALYSLLCLNPHLLPLIPLGGLLFYIMIPSFLARHPTSTNDPRMEPSLKGPAIAPPSRVKPAPDLSKDFFRNMRDLQNCMEDFSRVHDAANEYVTPYTNFSDESVSSALFTFLSMLCCAAFIGSQLMPWRAVALVSGWVALLSGHPKARSVLLTSQNLSQVRANVDNLQALVRSWVESDILLDEPPERRQVEIFELQKYHVHSDSWESWLFSPTPYDTLSPLRIAGARAKGTQFFEDVQPPTGWVWKDKKWTLDLASREWVEQRMITGIEIETEGERWVYDLPQETLDMLESPARGGKKGKAKVVAPKSGWEEGNGLGERGEWRRRRWVRVVERKVVGKANAKPG